jgi:adenylylsulfate kinase
VAPRHAFAVWLTGLPSSGKSTIARALVRQLAQRGVDCAVLESDELRKVFTPSPRYDENERDHFYEQTIYVGTLLVRNGVPVIIDATANRRAYRDRARHEIAKFLEVHVSCPIEVCMARDPKGIYRKAQGGGTVPGLQAEYEPPLNPEVVVRGDTEDADDAAQRILTDLVDRGYLAEA